MIALTITVFTTFIISATSKIRLKISIKSFSYIVFMTIDIIAIFYNFINWVFSLIYGFKIMKKMIHTLNK